MGKKEGKQTKDERESVVVLDAGDDGEGDADDCKEADCDEPVCGGGGDWKVIEKKMRSVCGWERQTARSCVR